MKIMIDAGHGGSESGAVASGYHEKELNLKLALLVAERLRRYCDVGLTRDEDVKLSLWERGNKAKTSGADLMLSLHFNAFDGKARGVEAIHSIKASADTIKLAKALTQTVAKATGNPVRRVFSKESVKYPGQDWYGIPQHSLPVPAIIFESLFLDNEKDVWFLKKAGALEILADAICNAIIEHYGLEIKNETFEAIEILVKAGIVNTPEYWRLSARPGSIVRGEIAAELIKKFANKLKEMKIV